MQVDLIVAVHDLLAEYGLCCSGKDGEGEEGTFLKFAVKHLMALDVKLKCQLSRFSYKPYYCRHVPCQLISDICWVSLTSCIDSNGMEEDAVPKIVGTQDSMVDEPLVNDSKQNSEDEEDEEESGKTILVIVQVFCIYLAVRIMHNMR